MKTRYPYEVKRLSKKIPTTPEWSTGELALMEQIVYNKFDQNEAFTALLIHTGDRQLHEASADMKWGKGAELSSKAVLQGEWTGEDHLGQILESVREKLKAKYPTLQSTDPPAPASSLEDETDDLTPMPEENDLIVNTTNQPNQSIQPSPRAKPTAGAQASITGPTQVNTGPQQETTQQQIPANRSKGKNKGRKKVQITGNQPATSQQMTGPTPQANDQIPSPPPRNRRARPQTQARIGQGSEH